MLMKPDQFELTAPALKQEQPIHHGFLTRVIRKLEAYAEHRRQRYALLALDDHLLKDIGVGRAEAEHIAAKPFDWRNVPTKMIR